MKVKKKVERKRGNREANPLLRISSRHSNHSGKRISTVLRLKEVIYILTVEINVFRCLLFHWFSHCSGPQTFVDKPFLGLFGWNDREEREFSNAVSTA